MHRCVSRLNKTMTRAPAPGYPRARRRYFQVDVHQGDKISANDPRHASSSDPPHLGPSGPGNISDHEWNLRAGRAIHTLRTTLPRFFELGLVSRVDTTDPSAASTSSPSLNTFGPRSNSESIYAPNVRLSYSPPSTLSLPAPFPKTLQVEGIPLYHASAAFIRHTLSAFNTNLHVEMRKLQVRSTGPRNREVAIRTGVSGKSRISGAPNEWDVLINGIVICRHSTYTLSSHSALIELHVVESIHPAPHVTFYDGLRAALAQLAGVGVDRGAGAGVRGCMSDTKLRPVPIQEKA